MHKFFTSCEMFTETHAIIVGEDVKHIYKVLRVTKGEKVAINNLQGEEFLGEVEEVNKQQVTIKLLEKLNINNESNIHITLFQGLPKAAKMDLIVQKCVELGVNEIVPTITDRVDIKLKGEFKKLDRLNKISLEACKQSKRSQIPKVLTPIDFKDALELMKNMDLIVIPYENATGYGVKSMIKSIDISNIKNIGIMVGPEGGFEENEIEYLKHIGAHIVTLGPRILRTETAGFTCIALLQYELGDVGGKF
ncbi:16S rRNA (uracil(1498)-N(3))-methyltransferase [Clostridium tarantellae]|uniref:Ribosomal RNA small subunit methyltransferase E n=1 Tax=Clostridium tarantellae TaxID=39493 RepID=A0A6I1MFH9_9CLOT|nr:16S rRNA (uracil(1498)-N(3))-methyltransferase [Clostridium tarantellae]MPQ42246.1 16S rRNA (uracil(1498)-N(3))-methyltransferase [Clostridium tarantellae]